MPNETLPVNFECAGMMDVVGMLVRGLAQVEALLHDMGDGRIEARISFEGRFEPTPPPPPMASGCHPPLLAEWKDLPASEAFLRMVPYVHGLLVALEARGDLKQPLSAIPGVLRPTA